MDALAWRVVGASVPGTAHRDSGTLCQDAHLYQVLPREGLLIAVADGAGSAHRAREGAALAVEQAVRALVTRLEERLPGGVREWRALVIEAFTVAREALACQARREGVPIAAFATTLTCVAASDGWLAVGQIGDGAAMAKVSTGALLMVARRQTGEYANESFFLTMPDALSFVEVNVFFQTALALVVTTDGLLRLMVHLPGCQPHLPFLEPLIAFVAEAEAEEQASGQLSAFLASDRVCARTDDDKTLVVAARLGAPAALTPPGGAPAVVMGREVGGA